MLWQELIKIALMGTERTQLSEQAKTALQAKGIQVGNDEARIILEGTAYYAMMQKSGFQALDWTAPIPPPAPEELPENICSPASVRCLQQILDNTFALALQEFIQLLQKNNQHLPAEFLPELLDQCRQSPALWEQLRNCIGARGAWIVNQNPEWLFLQKTPDPTIWETGSRAERKALLKNLRYTDTAKALALLESTWETEDVNSKTNFLKILVDQLSTTDEPFLEQCLLDRRKEIRELAAKLLSQIPQSALLQRMYERAIALIQVEKKRKKIILEVSLPEELSPEMIRDGIDPRNQWYQGGVKASRLGQMIAVIPPQLWEKYLEQSTNAALDTFLQSSWDQLFLSALSRAAAIHQNADWIEAILQRWFDHHHEEDWQNVDLQVMIAGVPAPLFNKMAISGLEKDSALIENTAPVGILLKELEHPWEDQLSIVFFRTLKSWLKNNPGQYWKAWHFWNILEKAAYLINPLLYPTLEKAFDKDVVWYQAAQEIDKFMHILKFRMKMVKSFDPVATNNKI